MRDAKRIRPLLDELAKIWERHPDMRLGQLLVAANGNQDPFHVEDADLIAKARRQFGPCDLAPDVRAALVECIRAAEMADWDLQTEGLADAILARFDVRAKP